MKSLLRSLLQKFWYQNINSTLEFKNILGDNKLNCFDVGAAYGLQPQWEKIKDVGEFYLFEPSDSSYKELLVQFNEKPNFHLFKTPLLDKSEEVDLYCTNVVTGTSIFPPDPKSEGFKYLRMDYFHPWTVEKFNPKRLDEVIKAEKLPSIDIIKIDTQGAELRILKGANNQLENCLTVEVEFSLVSIYENQDHLEDLLSFMRKKDYVVFDMRVSRQSINLDPISEEVMGRFHPDFCRPTFTSYRSYETDLVFFRNPDFLLSANKVNDARKLIAAFCIYNFFLEAFDLVYKLHKAALVTTAEYAIICKSIDQLFRLNRQRIRLHKFKGCLGFNDGYDYWARFMWIKYPHT